MPPIHSFTDWNKRPSDREEKIEPFRKYIFICEGEKTEVWYFKRLISLRKQLNIHPLIDIRLWERTEEDLHISAPIRLIQLANTSRTDEKLDFDPEHDKIIIVFDADRFVKRPEEYNSIITTGEPDNILAVTNPSFELFLLLHLPDSYKAIIKPHEKEILENKKDGSQRFVQKLLSTSIGINSKKNPDIAYLADNIMAAIQEEKNINQDIHNALIKLTSNVGKIVEMILHDSITLAP